MDICNALNIIIVEKPVVKSNAFFKSRFRFFIAIPSHKLILQKVPLLIMVARFLTVLCVCLMEQERHQVLPETYMQSIFVV